MKKNEIFLAVVGLLIAISGAFATKGVNKLVPITVWYTNHLGFCTSTIVEPTCTFNEPFDCLKPLDGALRTIYTTRLNQNVCGTPWKRAIQ